MKVELKENIKFTTSNIPFAPSYKPGLVTKNSGWRNEKPVCDKEKCNGCFTVLPRWRNFKHADSEQIMTFVKDVASARRSVNTAQLVWSLKNND